MREVKSVRTEYDYVPVRIPPGTDRASAAVLLSLQADTGGWELARVLLHADGTRKVTLRRRRVHAHLPGPVL
ncbi:MAG: DUF5703 family protein [Actinomycetota bacterium]|nr:DUF5703 family protein [Actinomycetota bacterium]